MFSRKSSTEHGSEDRAVQDGAVQQDTRYDGVHNDGTTSGTATGTTGAHARPVEPAGEHRDGHVATAGATGAGAGAAATSAKHRPTEERVRDTHTEPVRDERTVVAPETAHETVSYTHLTLPTN